MLQWTETKIEGPNAGLSAAVAVGDSVYCFGGGGSRKDGIDVNVLNTMSLDWSKLTPALTPGKEERPHEVPSWRCGRTAVLVGGIVYIWGGYNYMGRYCNELDAFDVKGHTWFRPEVSGTVPVGRVCHSACVLGKAMYIYGGSTSMEDGHGGCTNDIYKLDTTTMVWSSINTHGTLPPDSSSHSASIIGNKMFVFGGYSGLGLSHYNTVSNTVRVFDTEADSWMDIPPSQLNPNPRFGHSSFTYNGELYIYGGDSIHLTFNDMWKFNPETFSWKRVEFKGSFPMPRMCCCMVGNNRIVSFERNSPGHVFMLDLSSSEEVMEPGSRESLWEEVMEPGSRESLWEEVMEPGSRERLREEVMEPGSRERLREEVMEPGSRERLREEVMEPGSREGLREEVMEPAGSWCVLS